MNRTIFLRLVEAEDKRGLLSRICEASSRTSATVRYDIDPDDFRSVPLSPFTYAVPSGLRSAYRTLPPFERGERSVKQGLATTDDFRFVRLWWGLPAVSENGWLPFAKGGRRSTFYADITTQARWHGEGYEMYAFTGIRLGTSSAPMRSTQYFRRPGLTWPIRGARFSSQAVPAGGMFSIAGKQALGPPQELRTALAIFNSLPFDALIRVQTDAVRIQFEVGVIQRTPVPDLTPADEAALAALARRAWSLKRSLDTRTETSHAFVLPALLQVDGATFAERAAAWAARVRAAEDELATIQAEIDERCFALYGIGEEDRRAITEGFGWGAGESDEAAADDADAGDDEEEADDAADTATLAAELLSWAVGVAFGRFDVRLATGERELPDEPEPFDPLPACSPGMLTGVDGLPLAAPPAGYPVAFPADGVLVDDEGHPRDLVAAIRQVFEVIFGASADARWQETAALLDPKGHDLRAWLRSSFFEQHLRRHSKSRRKAPILWPLGVSSGRYAVWCYAHRLTADTLFAVGRDLVAPKLALEERRRTALAQDAGPNPTARQRAELAAQDETVEELRAFADEVRRVAPLWDPDLDDGVVLASAPLWRLVPHKGWQKDLKARWDELAKGKYDWAHLAMRLWPERVVPKCAEARSLAIAHGLEDVLWAEGADGKWSRRSRPSIPTDTLVAERTSPAVKAALADLQAAPAPAAARGRGRARE